MSQRVKTPCLWKREISLLKVALQLSISGPSGTRTSPLLSRVANDHRPGRLVDLEIVVELKIMVDYSTISSLQL